jgi:2-polyprenyl-6-methoxyphenol hydroxylase-like FAD-dependent oxidoreductase
MLRTQCCIVGGGPAGIMAGYLLARAGIDVLVLEKHKDFLRDFRGDTIHPSTLQVMSELGLLERLLERPHSRVETISGIIGHDRVRIADFRRLSTRCKFVAFMPQWDFLDFLSDEGKRWPTFHLKMEAEATGLRNGAGSITGVIGRSPDGPFEVAADLVIAADGRHSVLRRAAGLVVEELGAPMDVFWLRLAKAPADQSESLGRIGAGTMFVMIDRGDYWQCAMVIAKGSADKIRAKGLPAFIDLLARAAAMDRGRFDEIRSFDDVKLLSVSIDRLSKWARPGLLCIGDAAHAMSPIGGVGINLAIQDAVAAANLLADSLRRGKPALAELERVQRRRAFPTRATQSLQIAIQDRMILPALSRGTEPRAPWYIRMLPKTPLLRDLPARLIGLGFRPEHVALDLPPTPKDEALDGRRSP